VHAERTITNAPVAMRCQEIRTADMEPSFLEA
jgi:hypothetical protein